MRYIMAMLMAAVMLAVPAMAFDISSYDFSSIEDQDNSMVSSSGSYTYNRVAVDENNVFSDQNVYSGLIFGADEGVQYKDHDANTGAIVANKIDTDANIDRNGDGVVKDVDANGDGRIADVDTDGNGIIDPDEIEVEEGVAGVRSDITRQFIQQKGTAYVTLMPNDVQYDPEKKPVTPVVVDIGFTKSNLAWVSGDMDKFVATPVSYAVAGGNYMDAVPDKLSPDCNNVWLYEQEKEAPISIEAKGDAWLMDAYVGSASNAKLVMTDEWGTSGDASNYVKPTATMSGYAERFGGYNDAYVDESSEFVNGLPTNSVDIDFGDEQQVVSHYWNTGFGLDFDAPECEDFPADIPIWTDPNHDGVYTPTGENEQIVTWPNNLPERFEEGAQYDTSGNLDHINI